jgi:hypothetical protein
VASQTNHMMTMTMQEVFDKVARHLLAQGCKSTDKTGCMYRGPNDTKCAAGFLIADQHYVRELERQTATSCYVAEALMASGVPVEALALVDQLQRVHDNYEPDEWLARLGLTAAMNNLSADVLDGR